MADESISVITPRGNLIFPNQEVYNLWSDDPDSVEFVQIQTPSGAIYEARPKPQQVESPAEDAVDNTTYYENDGTSSSDLPYPQLTPDEQALAAQGDAGAGPGEISYSTPPADDTTYYENDGSSSSSVPYPQLTPEEQALSALGDAGAGPGEISFPSLGSFFGLTGPKLNTNSQATQQDVSNFKQKEDWRVRLSLAPGSNYLYNVPKGSAGILEPLQATNGVIFPYTPQISVTYQANYDPTELTHSNYKIFQYRNSGVDSITITCDFTAQDTYEANYLLAVIHFFRSVTKMFYGQDQNPKPGTPPPLCYLTGLGAFQFDAHPLAITSFNYSLPNDVDYIRAGAVTAGAGVNRSESSVKDNSTSFNLMSLLRLGSTVKPGGTQPAPIFTTPPGTVDPTYVPTKIQLSIGAVPVVTRNDISNNFSLEKYATGELLRGTKRRGGGIW